MQHLGNGWYGNKPEDRACIVIALLSILAVAVLAVMVYWLKMHLRGTVRFVDIDSGSIPMEESHVIPR